MKQKDLFDLQGDAVLMMHALAIFLLDITRNMMFLYNMHNDRLVSRHGGYAPKDTVVHKGGVYYAP